MNNENNHIQVLKATESGIFTNYIYKAIPLAFDESMSYYETLCGLLNYLQNTIIPTVNNNADAIIELQNNVDNFESNITELFNELQSYVDNYFNNLDVQQEINNKLDEMVEDGTLTQIIKDYVDPELDGFRNDLDLQEDKINVLESRVDEIASLPSGSTSGDAELIDIRTDFISNVYNNAGNSVRGQVTFLNDKINDINKRFNTVYEECILENGSIINPANQTYVHTTNYVPIKGLDYLEINIKDFTLNENEVLVYGYTLYDNSKEVLYRYGITSTQTDNLIHIRQGDNIKYVNIEFGVYNTSTETYRAIRKTDFKGYQVQVKTYDNSFINRINELDDKYNYRNYATQIYLGNNSSLYIESNNNILYVYFNSLISRVYFEYSLSISDILTGLDEEYKGTSPAGRENCIIIPNNYDLVLDTQSTPRIKVVSRALLNPNRYIELIDNSGGYVVKGALLEIYQNLRLTSAETDIISKYDYRNYATQFYLANNDSLYVESNNSNLYVKFDTLLSRVYFEYSLTLSSILENLDVSYKGTSPNGVENCIIIPNNYDLVLDTQSTPRIKVISRVSLNPNRYIELLDNTGGYPVKGALLNILTFNKLSNNDYNIPDYWISHINTKISSIQSNIANNDTLMEFFFFITDQHTLSNANNSSKLIKYLGNKLQIPLVLSGGDVVTSDKSNKIDAINEMNNYISSLENGYLNVFQTYGNHDYNNVVTDSEYYLTTNQIYNSMIKQREKFSINSSNIDVMKYDNTDKKIRYINFNCSKKRGETYNSDITTTILSYINELDNTWSIILFCHTYWDGQNTVYSVAEQYVDAIATNSVTCDAEMIALFTGHVHHDKDTVYEADNGGKLLIIGTRTDAYDQNNHLENPDSLMTKGTYTEQAFDVVQVNMDDKILYLTRIGAGDNRQFSYDFTE